MLLTLHAARLHGGGFRPPPFPSNHPRHELLSNRAEPSHFSPRAGLEGHATEPKATAVVAVPADGQTNCHGGEDGGPSPAGPSRVQPSRPRAGAEQSTPSCSSFLGLPRINRILPFDDLMTHSSVGRHSSLQTPRATPTFPTLVDVKQPASAATLVIGGGTIGAVTTSRL